MSASLAGHVSLVTGASSGIGAATARALAAAGARVYGAARRVDRVAALGDGIVPLALDVADDEAVHAAVARIVAAEGRLDSAVNVAGVMLSAPASAAKVADWRRMIGANLLGTMSVTHAALPHFFSRRAGHVVNVSSVSARLAHPGSPGYAATKSAVVTFTEAVRKEAAPYGVRVTLVSPGIVATELFDHLENPATRERFRAMMEAMQPLEPDDVADAILYALTRPAHVSISELMLRPTLEVE